jgi:hypothetical protein
LFGNSFAFASEADQIALLGGFFVALSIFALVMDHLRSRRERLRNLDRVGWIPWTYLFLAFAIIGLTLIATGLPSALFS